MGNTNLTLEEVFEEAGLLARWEARGVTMGEERKAIDVAQNMIKLGLPFETIVSATGLHPEKVKNLNERKE